jgi:hypothetical protein
VHVVTALAPEFLAEFDRPVGIGGLIVVDTVAAADVRAIAEQVKNCLDNGDMA